MTTRFRSVLLSSTALLGAFCIAMSVGEAAAADNTTSSASASEDTLQLETVVVTARKRTEDVQHVPLAVSVVGQLALQQHQVSDAYDLVNLTPSLQVEATTQVPGAQNFSIRGIGSAIYGGAVESSVGVVIDDVPMARPQLGIVQFFDLDRVEVLRGPQGMLFGKNASAGLINISTAAPKLNETSLIAHAEYGYSDSAADGSGARLDVAGNLPIGDDAAVVLAAFVSRQDAFVRNVTRNEDLGNTQEGARLRIYWAPREDVAITVSGDYQRGDGPAETVLVRSFDAPGGLVQGIDSAAGIVASPDNLTVAGAARTYANFNVGGVSMKTEIYLPDDFTLTNVAAYRDYRNANQIDTDSTPVSLFDVNIGNGYQRQMTEEVRLASPASNRLSFQAGFLYMNYLENSQLLQGADVGATVPAGMSLLGGFIKENVMSESYAGFAEGEFKITDRFRVTVGGRYTNDTLRYRISVNNPKAVYPLYADTAYTKILDQDNFSYRAGLQYDVAPSVLAYFTYTRGYKGPTIDTFSAAKVNPEIPVSFELGMKSELLDNRLRLNTALFYTTFNGFQTQAQLPGSAGQFVVLNAGKLKSQGVEVEFTALPFEGFTLNGGTTFNATKYINLTAIPCYQAEPTGTSGRNVCLPGGVQDVSGNQLANAPLWTASLTARYERPVFESWNGFVQGDLYYRSSFNFTQSKDPHTGVGATNIFGLSAGVQNEDGLTLTAFVRNLFDERVPSFIVGDLVAGNYVGASGKSDASLGGNYWSEYNANSFRTIGIALDYRM